MNYSLEIKFQNDDFTRKVLSKYLPNEDLYSNLVFVLNWWNVFFFVKKIFFPKVYILLINAVDINSVVNVFTWEFIVRSLSCLKF